jgi:hypothetical protein
VVEGGGNGGWDGGRKRPLKPWADKAVAAAQARSVRWRHYSDRVADGWAHVVLYFPELSKLAKIRKLKMDALRCSKNSQFLHVATLWHYKQFSLLCRDPILNIVRVKNPRIDSTFESLMNFKRDLNLLEKSDKFSKIPS